MKEVKAYVCSYCGGQLTTDRNAMIEHEKRCYSNPNKPLCFCSLCEHGKPSSYDDYDRFGRLISVGFFNCKIGCEYDEFYRYCEKYQEKKQ